MIKKYLKTGSEKNLADAHCLTKGGPVWLSQSEKGVFLDVHAQPGAKRDAIVGEYNARLKICLCAPPVDGKANAYLSKLLAKILQRPKSEVVLVSGETCRAKRFLIKNARWENIASILMPNK